MCLTVIMSGRVRVSAQVCEYVYEFVHVGVCVSLRVWVCTLQVSECECACAWVCEYI